MDERIQTSHSLQKSPEEYFQAALKAFKEITGVEVTPDQEARLLIEAGKMCDLSGDWDQALDRYKRALELCESEEVKAEALKQTAHINSKRGEWEAALDNYKASLEILNRIGNLREAGNIYNSIGYNYFETGDMAKAEQHYNRALEIAQRCDDAQLTADIYSNLGILSCVKGQIDEAIAHYERSIPGYEESNDIHGLAQVYHNLGMAYTDKEVWELAGECYQKSMELCIEIGELDLLSIIYTNRARLALYLHDPSVARIYSDKAFAIFRKTGNKLGMAEVLKLYGVIHSHMRQWDSAERSFRRGIRICEKYSNKLTKAEIHYELGSMNIRRHEKDGALCHLQKALEIYESLGIDNEVRKIQNEIRAIAA